MTSDANAARLSILGIEKLERKISPKSAKGNGYLFVQPSNKVMQLYLQDQVQSLLGSCTLAEVGTTAFKAGVILLDHLQAIGHEFAQDGSTDSEQVIDLASEWKQVRVEWLSGNGEGHEWYPADLSSTDRPHHKVSAHNGLTINLPVYKLVYHSDEKSYHVVFLSKNAWLTLTIKKAIHSISFVLKGIGKHNPMICRLTAKSH